MPLTPITAGAAAEPALPMPQMAGIIVRDASGQLQTVTFEAGRDVVAVHRPDGTVATVPLAAAAGILQGIEQLLQNVADVAAA